MEAGAGLPSTGSVTLSDISPANVTETYVGWLNDPLVTGYTEARFQTHTRASVEAYVRATAASADSRLWRILHEGRHVGNVRLSGLQSVHRRASLAILIGDRSVWGRGVASQAIALAASRGFGEFHLHKIVAGVYARNVASERAFLKAGFHREAVLRENRILDGAFVDEIIMARIGPLGSQRGVSIGGG